MRASTGLRLSVGAFLVALSCAAIAENAETSEPASVRAGPDSSYPEVARLDADTPIQVIGCLDDWSWCDVVFDGNRGWLYSPDITYLYQGGYVPLYSYAPGLGVPVLSFSVDSYWGSHYHDRPWYGEREQWAHRTIRHQRPSGPPPSSSPPPRQAVRMDRSYGGPQSDRSIHLGNAGPSHQDAERQNAERHDGATGHVDPRVDPRAPEPRRQEHAPQPPQHTEMSPKPPERSEERAVPQHPFPQHTPPEHAVPQHAAPEHVAPEHQEARSRPGAGHAEPQHAEPQHREEQHHPAEEKPEGPPRQE